MINSSAQEEGKSQSSTQRIPIFHYYFSNLNVMKEKSTAQSRKIQDLYLSASRESLEERHSEYLEEELCLQHSLPIEYICFSCSDSVLCSQCMTDGSHVQHDIKNIERSKQFLKGQLQVLMIELESKKQILEVYYYQIKGNSEDVFEFTKHYNEKLSSQVEQLIKALRERLAILQKSVDQFSNDYKADCNQKLQQNRIRRLELAKMIDIIKGKIQKTSIQHQAQFFSEKKMVIDQLLGEQQIKSYEQQFVEPSWGVETETFRKIQADIDKITVTFKYPDPYRDLFMTHSKAKESTAKISNKKSKKELKLPETQKLERVASSKGRISNSITPFLSTFTPKNTSKQKRFKNIKKIGGETLIKKRKKSSNKILSMPASPEREPDSSVQTSPCKSRKHIFKKKENQ